MNNIGKIIGLVVLSTLSTISVGASEPDPKELLTRMSHTIAGLERFVIHGEAFVDAGLGAGQIIEQASEVTARVMRPAALRITNRDAEGFKELHFVNGTLSIHTQPKNYYAQTQVPNQIEAAVEYAMEELEIDAPLLDLLTKDPAATFTTDAESIQHLGSSLIRGEPHHHIAIRGPELDLQVWIASDGPTLPGKIVMTSRWVYGSPRFTAFMRWDLEPVIAEGSLAFRPPPDAVRIEFIQNIEEGGSNE